MGKIRKVLMTEETEVQKIEDGDCCSAEVEVVKEVVKESTNQFVTTDEFAALLLVLSEHGIHV
jgi:hypothetical protein